MPQRYETAFISLLDFIAFDKNYIYQFTLKRMFHKAQPSFVSLRTINNRYGKSTAKTTVTETKDGFRSVKVRKPVNS